MPPDAVLNKEFSQKSDVWSFGVVLWEIFSFGQTPFDTPEVSKFSARAFAEYLAEGHQMNRPEGAPVTMFVQIREMVRNDEFLLWHNQAFL